MKGIAIDIGEVAEAPKLWQEIVDASDDGWVLHTWLFREFNLFAGKQYRATDHSFFIYEDGKPVGVVPLVIQEKYVEGSTEWEAMYYSGFLPWPCFRQGVSDREALEDFAFAELERRMRETGAHRSLFLLMPPQNTGDEEARVRRIAARYGFAPRQFDRHIAAISGEALRTVRKSYRWYHKKFSSSFAFSTAEREGVTPELEEAFFQLHVKDAGGQFRSRESYAKQADMARGGEAFYMVATHTESGVIAGMALVSLYKNAAYYSSVAVDPDFASQYVGHLLQWGIIEELQKRKISTYELGPKAHPGSATQKELGITLFKEGWSRGHTRTIWGMEKFPGAK